MRKKIIQHVVANFFRKHDKDFVNELARLLILYGDAFRITDTPKHLSMWLAHVKAEVDIGRHGSVKMRENMNYSESGLKKIFKNFRKNPKLARRYGRNKQHKANQRMIANIAYAKRLGNGSIESGDGWRYRGAGVLQTTGKENFEKDLRTVEEITGMKLHDLHGAFHTEWADSYTIGTLLGMANWYRTEMYHAQTMDQSTRIINRYTTSYGKRRRYYAQVKKLLGTPM